jgi:hypothetical protein
MSICRRIAKNLTSDDDGKEIEKSNSKSDLEQIRVGHLPPDIYLARNTGAPELR